MWLLSCHHVLPLSLMSFFVALKEYLIHFDNYGQFKYLFVIILSFILSQYIKPERNLWIRIPWAKMIWYINGIFYLLIFKSYAFASGMADQRDRYEPHTLLLTTSNFNEENCSFVQMYLTFIPCLLFMKALFKQSSNTFFLIAFAEKTFVGRKI